MCKSPQRMYRYLIISATLLGLAGCGMHTLSGGTSTGSAPSRTHESSGAQTPSNGPTGRPSTANLTCTSYQEPVTADSLTITLSCAVAGADSDETSFMVSYTAIGPGDQGRSTLAVCSGPVSSGRGTCTVTFGTEALDARSVELVGELLPSHRTLGPQTPVPAP